MSDAQSLYAPNWLTCPDHPAELNRTIWTDSFQRNHGGELTIDGIAASELVEEFDTPQYVFSEDTFRARARGYRRAFEDAFARYGAQASVYYAGKSFLCTAVARWAHEEGLCLDTASGGELAIALRAQVPGQNIALHGNNKSYDEIKRAIKHGVGRVVVDSIDELKLIMDAYAELCAESVAEGLEPYPAVPVLIRITPGVHASTHESIATAHEDQKFGMSLQPGTARLAGLEADELEYWSTTEDESYAMLAAGILAATDSLEFRGIHCHIGSQIFEAQGFEQAADTALTFMHAVNQKYGLSLPELDLGGGYGIGYTEADTPRSIEQITVSIADAVAATCERLGMTIPHMSFEPGRSISGPSGVTLYTVGTIKNVSIEDEHGQIRVRRYVSVDGGMSDNARPVLYDADYTVTLANRAPAGEQVLSRVVGKHCESGDIVVRYCYLPADLCAGDILAVPATGAYCYVLGSNYNYLSRPPVIATSAGEAAHPIIRRQSEDEMLALDTGF